MGILHAVACWGKAQALHVQAYLEKDPSKNGSNTKPDQIRNHRFEGIEKIMAKGISTPSNFEDFGCFSVLHFGYIEISGKMIIFHRRIQFTHLVITSLTMICSEVTSGTRYHMS